jgi:amino acid transporter
LSSELRRSLSLPVLVLYGLGTTVGAGIYALTGKVAGQAGMLTPLSFALASALAAFTAFSFAELGGRLPRSAGEAVYVREGLHAPVLGLIVGLRFSG